MKNLSHLLIASSIGLFTQFSSAECLETMERAVMHAAAYQYQVDVVHVKLIRAEMGAWTEATANNKGTGEFTVSVNDQLSYIQVFAKQKYRSANCSILAIKPMAREAVNPLALKAEVYKLAIGDALHISEGEVEWSLSYSYAKVTAFTKSQIAAALKITSHFEIYTEQETLNFLVGYATDSDDETDGPKYAALLELMKKDFKKFRLIKVGEPDSGGLDLHLLGITPEGHLVGLKTISVET